jgi:signal transduction histidine kinase/CheY-like chemotaxis protein
MAAAQFPADAVGPGGALVERGWLAGAVTVMTLLVLVGTLLLLLIDAQASARAASMQASLAESAESNRAKDEFLAMLGHELRNPLAAITAAIHLLDKAQPGAEQWSFARDVIARQSQHLKSMVDDLLDVGRAINGKLALDMQVVDLDQAVRSALGALAAAGRTAGRKVSYRGAPVCVRGDRTRIEQVITNLVSNAATHTAAGGLIEVSVGGGAAAAVVSVRDDGVGLERETAARVFELFFQGRQEISRSRGGLGVGLTLVQRIVEAHGGTVGVASEGAGKGATFTVQLPAIEDVAAQPVATAALKRAAPRCVVLVEDADDTRSGLERALGEAGHRVVSARTGVEGLLRILEAEPDVALVDIGLPGMDGYEVARRVRLRGSRAYLVALTGYGSRADQERARHAGFDAHVTKPATVGALLELLAEAPRAGRH